MNLNYLLVKKQLAARLAAALCQECNEEFKNKGNPEALIKYWRDGPGHDRINWDDPEGNLTRCHKLLTKYVDSETAWGFCANRHIELYGESNATRDKRLEAEKKKK